MNIGIIGSRTFTNYDTLKKSIDKVIKEKNINENITIVSGGARGADTLGEAYSVEISAEALIHKPQWDKYGKRAGFIRNHKIIDDSNLIVAYWDGYSKGTEHTINEARVKNKEVIVFNYHYLNLQNCKNDKEIYEYLIKEQPKGYTLWVDNDSTFITIGMEEDLIKLDNYLGTSLGVPTLLDLLGIYWSYV